jgi:hypothetical protein
MRFPGAWQVRVMESNRAALDFWGRCITAWNDKSIQPTRMESGGEVWFVFAFESRVEQ